MSSSGVRIVLVEPEYPINIGLCARALKNFGYKQMYMVNPKCKIKDEAYKFAKHGKDILENAKICKSIDEAVEGCKFVAGTSGVLKRHKRTLRNPIETKDASKKKYDGNLAILFGREGIGLTEDEIDRCDFLIHIPASRDYPVLNLSHAVAITAYEFSGMKIADTYDERKKKYMFEMFDKMIDGVSKKLMNPWKFKIAFRRVIGRAAINEKEISILTGVFSFALKDLEELKELKKPKKQKKEPREKSKKKK